MIAEKFRDEVDAMPGQVSCDGEQVEKDRDRVRWVFGIFERVDGSQTEFIVRSNLG